MLVRCTTGRWESVLVPTVNVGEVHWAVGVKHKAANVFVVAQRKGRAHVHLVYFKKKRGALGIGPWVVKKKSYRLLGFDERSSRGRWRASV